MWRSFFFVCAPLQLLGRFGYSSTNTASGTPQGDEPLSTKLLRIFTRVTFGSEPEALDAQYALGYLSSSGSMLRMADVGPGTIQEAYLRNSAGAVCSTLCKNLKAEGVQVVLGATLESIKSTQPSRVTDGGVVLHFKPSCVVGDPVSIRSDLRKHSSDGHEERLGRCETSAKLQDRPLVVHAKTVVLAVPPALLCPVSFSPPLPLFRQLLNHRARMGSLIKTLFLYPAARHAIWEEQGLSGEATSDATPLSSSEVDKALTRLTDSCLADRLREAAVAARDVGCLPVFFALDVSKPMTPSLVCFSGGKLYVGDYTW